MPPTDATVLWPMIIVAGTAILVLLLIAVRRSLRLSLAVTLLGLLVAFIVLIAQGAAGSVRVGELVLIDQFARYFMGLIMILTAMVVIFIYLYFRAVEDHREELFTIVLVASLGGLVLASSDHLISFFLALETLTVSLYVMISYLRRTDIGLEAGLKYLILAAAASAFLVLGMALIYSEAGVLRISELAAAVYARVPNRSLYLLAGTGLIVVGIGFKLGVVPFHMWTPDVYQGAPAPVTAFVASVSKVAMVAILLRYALYADLATTPTLFYAVGGIAVLSMLIGNIMAIIQKDLKRLLAYSSIAHLGYLLVGVVAVDGRASEAVIYYVTVYSLTILGSFGLIALISKADREMSDIEAFRGLFWRRPVAAGLLSIFLFSLAGIPLTAGFIGKYLIILSGVGSALIGLVIVLIVSSVIGLYYYLRVIAVMVSSESGGTVTDTGYLLSGGRSLFLGLVAAAIVYLGVYPGPLVDLIRLAVLNSFL